MVEAMPKRTLFLIHGSGRKPAGPVLEALWREALASGLERDFPKSLDAFFGVDIRFVYFGDWSAALHPHDYDEALDIADRQRSIAQLKELESARRFRRSHYERLPGKSSLGEFLADIGLPVIASLGFGKAALSRLMPELGPYWSGDEALERLLTEQLRQPLEHALRRGDSVMIAGHCIGSVLAFDQLRRIGESDVPGKVARLVTLGSPLGDETVKRQLEGNRQKSAVRLPNNIIEWHNLAAEDDYVSHDNAVANDFAELLKHRAISVIDDKLIYNLAVRYNRSNPHSALGYLIHPRMARLLDGWLKQ